MLFPVAKATGRFIRRNALMCYNNNLSMEKDLKKNSETLDDIILLCPLCGRELDKNKINAQGGWKCKCGEFIPKSLAVNPFEGCTHGLNCNCGREKRK